MNKPIDENLLDALTKAYTARAQFFHHGIYLANVDLLVTEIDSIDPSKLSWNLKDLGISHTAHRKIIAIQAHPHQVFAHPNVVSNKPHLVAYYRNLSTISKKGIAKILYSTEKYESRRRTDIDRKQALQLCRTFNKIVSGVIDNTPDYSVKLSRQAIIAEIGTELQGGWVNVIGQGATKAVASIFEKYITDKGLGRRGGKWDFQLKNGWKIQFSSEPDVAFFDSQDKMKIAIEIKGSLDVAGAQTRYGEAKKSFAKQLQVNPHCYTVYLASCFTEAVIEQIKTDGQVRDCFNLTSILYDEKDKELFLDRLFYIVNIPDI